MDQLPPIPTPASQRWREFRIQALPVLTFLAVLAGVVTLWQRYVLPSNIVAEVEAVRANIVSTLPGTLQELKVERFQRVTKGQEIALITTMDPETLKAEVGAIQANLQVLKARMQLDVDRNQQTYETERLRMLQQRVELAVTRAQLVYLTNEANRLRILMEEKQESPSNYEKAALAADAARVSIEQLETYLAEYEKTLPKIQPTVTDPANDPILQAIRAEEEKLRVTMQPISLKAPFDGMVSSILHRAGERVVDGDPIAVISAQEVERIVGFVKQPITTRPKVGDVVQVRRRSFQREVQSATIMEVGSQLELISATLLPADTNPRRGELGLPFLVKVPQGMNLLPGETVDVILNPIRR